MTKELRLKTTRMIAIICVCCLLNPAQAITSEKLEFSGFARAVVGYINEDDVNFNNYDNSLNFDSETLLGLRIDYKINEKLNIVTQGVVYANDDRKSKIQWLYLDYRPSNNLSFKIGRQRAPLFDFSEVIDVGFAYPWISLPQSVYIPFLFTEYDGVLATYEFSRKRFSGSFDAYYGGFDNEIALTGDAINADVEDFFGLIGSVDIGEFTFRASIHHANAEVIIEELVLFRGTLTQLGFTESANALEIDDSAEYKQFSIKWENIDYFARVEFSKFDSDALLIPNNKGYYVTVGYNFYPFTAHATLSSNDIVTGAAPNEIPVGLDPQLDFLAAQFQAATMSTSLADIETASIGIRYDFRTNIAFKVDITKLKGKTGDTSLVNTSSPFSVSRDAELFQLAVEWIF